MGLQSWVRNRVASARARIGCTPLFDRTNRLARKTVQSVRVFFMCLPMSPTRQLFLLLLATIGGVATGRAFGVPAWSLVVLALGVVGGVFMRARTHPQRVRIWMIAIGAALCICLGFMRGERVREVTRENASKPLPKAGQLLIGKIEGYPERSAGAHRYVLRVRFVDKEPADLRIKVSSPRYPTLSGGEVVTVRCRQLKKSEKRDAEMGVAGSCFASEAGEVLAAPRGLAAVVSTVRTRIYERATRVLHEPAGSFIRGLVYGADGELSRDLKEAFRRAGVSHVVAVSGTNVGLITVFLYNMLVATLLPRKRAVIATMISLVGFLMFVGFEAPVVRATITGSLYLVAKYVGRPMAMWNIFGVTVACMLLASPSLMFAMDFELTVAATFGVLFLAPRFWKAEGSIMENLRTTIAATITTTPMIVATTGSVSLISIVANLVVVPMAELAFGFGAFVLVISVISETIAAFFAMPLEWIANATLTVIEGFAELPYALITVTSPAWIVVAAYVLVVAVAVMPRGHDEDMRIKNAYACKI